MKSHLLPLVSPTFAKRPSGVSPYAPCRNRTCNLMIKSHFRGAALPRTGSAQPHLEAIAPVSLVQTTPPIAARSSREAHRELYAGDLVKLPQPNQKKEKISKSTRDKPRKWFADAHLVNDKFNGNDYYRPESR